MTMVIPEGFSLVNILFGGTAVPRGAAITFGVDNGGQTSNAVTSDVIGALTVSGLIDNLSTSINTVMVRAKNGPNATGPFAENPHVDAGAGPAAAVVPNTAGLVKKSTALGGRKGRGRFYLPGLPEGNVDSGGSIDSALVTAINTDLATFLATLATNGSPMVLLHSDLTTPTLVTSLSLEVVAATQRRRLRR